MSNNLLRVSKINRYNISYNKNSVTFKDQGGNSKEVKEVVDNKIDKKISGLNNKKLYKELKSEDKSEGKYDLIKVICEEILKSSVDINRLNGKLEELKNKEFPLQNKNDEDITKEEIISYSLSKFGKEMSVHVEIALLMNKDNVIYKDLKSIRNRIEEYKKKKENYLENAKKGITKSIVNNKISENKTNRYKELLDIGVFETTINSYGLATFISSVNNRDKASKSIYDVYKEHQKSLYGTREKPIRSNRLNRNVQNLDRLIREYLELKKLNAKYINDNELNFEEVENVLLRKIKNKEINFKLNKKSLNTSEDLINERIKSNMFRKLNYYSYESSNFLFQKRINITKNNNCLHLNEEQMNKVMKIELDQNIRYNIVLKNKEEKQLFIEKVNENLTLSNNVIKQSCEVSESLEELRNLEIFDVIDKTNVPNNIDIFNSNYKVIYDYIQKVKKSISCIDFNDDLNINDMKELSDIENESNRGKLNKKFINKGEMAFLVYEEFQRVREFRNLLNHTDKLLGNLNDIIVDEEINNILKQYFYNIRLDLEHSGLYKIYNENIKELFLNSLVNSSENRYHFTPSFKEVVKNDNFNYQSKKINKDYYNLLKKIYNNLFIVDKVFQESNYNNAVNKLNTDDVKKGFSKSKKLNVESKLLELQDKYNTRLNLKNEEGNEKYVLSCIYAHLFNEFLKDKNFEIVQESNSIEIIDTIFNKFKNNNNDKFINELKDMNSYFFYLLKNLSEKSRNSLEHQLKSYSENFDNIVDIKICKILPLFKYFKNYNNKFKFKEINVELFFTGEALVKCDSNGSKFKTRLYQHNGVNEEKQLSLHISNMFNSIYIDKIVKFFEDNKNEEFKINGVDVERLYKVENNKIDLNEILKIEDKKEKNNKLIEFNKNKNIKSKVMLEDLASVNYILNDIYAILLKFATTSGIILNKLFSEEVLDSQNYENEESKKEFFKMKNEKKIELLNEFSDNKELDGKLKLLVSKLKEDEENKNNHDLNVIRNAFCHYNKELFELSILDMINLIRYLCSFDRKQKNNVTRAIVNYLSKKGVSVEFEFNNDHFIDDVVLKNVTDEREKPYYSKYKLRLMEELFKF